MKRKFLDAEIRNDKSLKWCEYRYGEMLWSDVHQTEVRFVKYEGDLVRVSSLNSMQELPDLVNPVWVRRPSVMPGRDSEPIPEAAKKYIIYKKQLERALAK